VIHSISSSSPKRRCTEPVGLAVDIRWSPRPLADGFFDAGLFFGRRERFLAVSRRLDRWSDICLEKRRSNNVGQQPRVITRTGSVAKTCAIHSQSVSYLAVTRSVLPSKTAKVSSTHGSLAFTQSTLSTLQSRRREHHSIGVTGGTTRTITVLQQVAATLLCFNLSFGPRSCIYTFP